MKKFALIAASLALAVGTAYAADKPASKAVKLSEAQMGKVTAGGIGITVYNPGSNVYRSAQSGDSYNSSANVCINRSGRTQTYVYCN